MNKYSHSRRLVKKISALLLILLLIACSSSTKKLALAAAAEADVKDTKGFDILMSQFYHNIENIWGFNEVLIAGPKDFIKYTHQYKNRSHINFSAGTMTVETIADNNQIAHLRQTILGTLMIGNTSGALYYDTDNDDIPINKELFILLDVDNREPVCWQWCAVRFADYLLQNHLKTRISGIRKIWYLTIQLVPNYIDKRANKYLSMISNASRQYGVDQALILAIIQIESSFNPYAVSHSDALGLMQVVQRSAGRDVFQMKGKWGQPSRSYLFDPKNNIDIGTAYLAMLQDSYLGGIINPISRRYAVITAYNSGVSSVLKVFSQDQQKAFKIINHLQPEEVYQVLYTQHPSAESRRYLYKVNNLLMYSAFGVGVRKY